MLPAVPQIYFDFGELGRPGWEPIHPLELQIIWQGAQDIISAAESDPRRELATLGMIQGQRQQLLEEALQGRCTDTWVSRALLIAALQGHLLGRLPEYTWDLD